MVSERQHHFKVIYHKDKRKYAYALAHNIWPQEVHFKAEIDIFLTFMLINFLVQMLKCTETLILVKFCL